MDESRNKNGKRACACCGYITILKEWDICPVWEDNWYQLEHFSDEDGPNRVNIVQARKNFIEFGACELRSINSIRLPFPEEFPKS